MYAFVVNVQNQPFSNRFFRNTIRVPVKQFTYKMYRPRSKLLASVLAGKEIMDIIFQNKCDNVVVFCDLIICMLGNCRDNSGRGPVLKAPTINEIPLLLERMNLFIR